MLNPFKRLLRHLLILSGLLIPLMGCNALRNALTPLTTEVTLVDTIYIDKVQVDTIAITLPVDTIRIETERLSARVIRSYDTISVEIECKADTVIVTNTIELPTKTKIVTRLPWWFNPLLVLSGILLLALVIKRSVSYGPFRRRY